LIADNVHFKREERRERARYFVLIYLTIWFVEKLAPFGSIMKMGAHGVHKGMVGRAKVPYLWGLDVLSMKGFIKRL